MYGVFETLQNPVPTLLQLVHTKVRRHSTAPLVLFVSINCNGILKCTTVLVLRHPMPFKTFFHIKFSTHTRECDTDGTFLAMSACHNLRLYIPRVVVECTKDDHIYQGQLTLTSRIYVWKRRIF